MGLLNFFPQHSRFWSWYYFFILLQCFSSYYFKFPHQYYCPTVFLKQIIILIQTVIVTLWLSLRCIFSKLQAPPQWTMWQGGGGDDVGKNHLVTHTGSHLIRHNGSYLVRHTGSHLIRHNGSHLIRRNGSHLVRHNGCHLVRYTAPQ